MKIRARHPILDRITVILVLLMVLILLGKLALFIEQISNARKQSTIQYMLQVALQPVGTTMYIWGGGWDDEDQTAGTTSTQMGLSAQWENFAKQQNAAYDFNNHRLERENGLDCSGYVGWVVYNTFETESGREGYVVTSTDMAKNFADRGWGTYIENPTEFLVGDIVKKVDDIEIKKELKRYFKDFYIEDGNIVEYNISRDRGRKLLYRYK